MSRPTSNVAMGDEGHNKMFHTGTSTLATLEKYRQYREATSNTPSQYATLDKYCTINRQPEYATIGKYRTITQVPSDYETIDHYRTYGKEPQYSAKLDNAVTYKYYGQYDEIVYTPTPSLCYVVVTCRSLLWTLLTLGATLIVVASIITPQWMIGKPKWVGLRSDTFNGTAQEYHQRTYNPTIGIFNRCTKVHRYGVHKDHCATYVTGFDMPSSDFSDYWKSALILFTVAVIMLGVTVISSIFSLCVRAVFRKSIFTVSGLIQSIAGLFLIVGMILYPVGWGSDRVRNLCGDHAGPFMMDECSLGWAFFGCIGGIILVFVCAVLSIQADVSTSSDKVENEIMEGKNLICIM